MNSLDDQIVSLLPYEPKTGDLCFASRIMWGVKPDPKGGRPVVVLSVEKSNNSAVVVPVTSSLLEDQDLNCYCYPLTGCLVNRSSSFRLKKASHAVSHMLQAVSTNDLYHWCGTISDEVLEALKHLYDWAKDCNDASFDLDINSSF